MLTKSKALLSKKPKEHIRSTFQSYKLEKKLLQELGYEMEIIMKC